uniref:Uncharacterized protein n=1 Tax=Glossina palpalis gambiensis TaxID=67801 RepID=A0A1B0B6V5_9MUSC
MTNDHTCINYDQNTIYSMTTNHTNTIYDMTSNHTCMNYDQNTIYRQNNDILSVLKVLRPSLTKYMYTIVIT